MRVLDADEREVRIRAHCGPAPRNQRVSARVAGDPAGRGPGTGASVPWRSGRELRHCGGRSMGVPRASVERFVDRVDVYSVLPMRAAFVAGGAAALAILALASLSPALERPRASVAEARSFRAPVAAPVAYSRDPLAVLSRR